GLTWSPPASLEWIGSTLAGFARGRLLEGSWSAGASRSAKLLVRLAGPIAFPGLARPLKVAGTLLFVAAPLLGLVLIATAALLQGLTLMPPAADPTMLAVALLLVLAVAEAARALGYLANGRPLEHIGIGWSWGIPAPRVVPPTVSPVEHRLPALWGIGAHVLLGGLAAAVWMTDGGPLWGQLVCVSTILLVLDLAPIFDADGSALLVAWSGDPQVWDRTCSFLYKRFLPRLTSGEPLYPEERRLLPIGCASMVGAAAALNFGTVIAKGSLAGIGSAIGQGGSPVTMALCIALLLGAVGGLAFALAQLVLTPVRLLAASGLRGEPVARWMFPLGLAAAGLLLVAPTGPLVAGFFILAAGVPVLLWQQFRAIPGSRLGAGYAILWVGLIAGSLAWAPRALELLGSFDSSLIPKSVVWFLAASALAGYAGAGIAAVWEASKSVFHLPRFLAVAAIILIALAHAPSLDANAARGAIAALAAGLFPAGALAMLVDRRGTPMKNFWRPFALGAALLAASVLHPGLGLKLYVAGLAGVAAGLLASRAMFAIPMPLRKRSVGQRAGGTDLEVLWDGSAHVLSSIAAIAAYFLGEDRAAKLTQKAGALSPEEPGFGFAFEKGELTPSQMLLPEFEWLARSLVAAMAILERELVGSAGRQFFERAAVVSCEGLYWLEWEIVHRHLLQTTKTASTGAALLEQVSRLPLFRELAPRQLEEMVRVLRRERFEAGEHVVKQGETGDRFYIVNDGKLVVLQEDGLGFKSTLARLGPGDCFGELALLGAGVRAASVVAEESTGLVSLVKADFEQFIADRENVTNLIRHGEFLLRIQLFSTLPSAILSRLAGAIRHERYAPGQPLLTKGGRADRLLLVKEGRLDVGGALLGPGDAFGREAMVASREVPFDVVASEPVSVGWLAVQELRSAVGNWFAGFESLEAIAKRQEAASWEVRA
ncbi:MAG: cyclic nucleotide-binding domain-containing protein, partial [Candidatus Wallbacteria bacterium]|nr:cyclic nucleotide-binding domain-containing protein [Candidatus Wallbacteria bacterium]